MLKGRPAFFANREDQIGPIRNRLVPDIVVSSAFEDDEGRGQPALRVRSYDCCHPFYIAWLHSLRSLTSPRACDGHMHADNAHLEATFVKVVGIFVQDAVLGLNVLY